MDVRVARAVGRQRTLRKILRQVHLWLGLTAGLFLTVIGLSGSALVFAEQMVRAEAPALYDTAVPSEQWRPVSEWIASAEQKYPDMAPLTFVFGPGTIPMPTGVPIIFKLTSVDGEERHTLIPIDAKNGTALDRINAEDTWAGWLVIFHKELLAHDAGILIVALSGIVGLISVCTGLYLWWPRPGRWQAAFTIRRGARGQALLYDLHSAPAAWLLFPLSVILLSGLWIQKPKWVDPVVGLLSSMDAPPPAAMTSSPAGSCSKPTAVDDAVTLAREGREHMLMRHVLLPMGPAGVYSVELREPGTNSRADGIAILVDRHCPRVTHVESLAQRSAGESLKAWKWPLHTDLMLGVPGQILVFLSGLLLPGLFITGFLLWNGKRR